MSLERKVPYTIETSLDPLKAVRQAQQITLWPQWKRDNLLFKDLGLVNRQFPDFVEGGRFITVYEANPQAWVPEPELIKSALFGGYESYEEMEKGITERFRTFASTFTFPVTDHYRPRKRLKDRQLNPTNIEICLDVVKKHLEG